MARIEPYEPHCKLDGIPEWHFPATPPLEIVDRSEHHQFVKLANKSASLMISKFSIPNNGWNVSYEQQNGLLWCTKIQIVMSAEDLAAAFGLSNECDPRFGQNLINAYGGDVAREGAYIRWNDCLNIPGPAYGYQGEPTLSITLTKDLKEIVRQLIVMDT